MKKSKKYFIASAIFFAAFAALTFAVIVIDRAKTGVNDTEVGLSSVNFFLRDLVGENDIFYNISFVLGLISLSTAAAFAFYGGITAIKRKSIKKVDVCLLLLGGLYILLAILYVLFDKIPINYRPVLEDGKTEASYPSTHTLLAIVIFGSAPTVLKRFIQKSEGRTALFIVFYNNAILTVLFRFLSGVHWFTDVAGGILLSLAMVFLYNALLVFTEEKSSEE